MGVAWIDFYPTPERYCVLYWADEKYYSKVLESKLVEPKEATVGAIARWSKVESSIQELQ